MRRKCSKCLKKLCQEIFKLITILIDLAYGIYHFFLKEEEAKIRYANMVKFISTAFFKTLDTFKTFCCSSCFSKKKSGRNLDYEDILEELDYEIDRLTSKKDILKKISKETNRENENYLLVCSKLVTINKIKTEIKGITKTIIS